MVRDVCLQYDWMLLGPALGPYVQTRCTCVVHHVRDFSVFEQL